MAVKPIDRAISAIGSQRALANAIDVNPSLISQWATDRRPIAAHHCIRIEGATCSAVTRYDLRPDVFGKAPDRAA